jgi:hypothetical protein
MFRKFLSSGAGILALLCITALPSQVYAQRGRGGFRPGMTPQMGRMGMGFNTRMMNPMMTPQVGLDRRFINPNLGSVPSFDRRFINPRMGFTPNGTFTPNINGTFLNPRLGFGSAFNRSLIDSRLGRLTPGMNPQIMNLGLERQLLALHMGLF